jgi:hypothetical protein
LVVVDADGHLTLLDQLAPQHQQQSDQQQYHYRENE